MAYKHTNTLGVTRELQTKAPVRCSYTPPPHLLKRKSQKGPSVGEDVAGGGLSGRRPRRKGNLVQALGKPVRRCFPTLGTGWPGPQRSHPGARPPRGTCEVSCRSQKPGGTQPPVNSTMKGEWRRLLHGAGHKAGCPGGPVHVNCRSRCRLTAVRTAVPLGEEGGTMLGGPRGVSLRVLLCLLVWALVMQGYGMALTKIH